MKNMLMKEIKLAASPLSFLFIAFSVMAFIPGYPILVGSFFICFGIFHSFQTSRENNDMLYTILLPIKKTDAVKSKYIFVVAIEIIGIILTSIFTLIRMTALKDVTPYVENPLMNANQAYIAYSLLIFTIFNTAFLNGFFKTAYKFTKPFIAFLVLTFLTIGIGETLHHIPGLEVLNQTAPFDNLPMWLFLIIAIIIYALATIISCKASMKTFEKIDM